MNSQSLRIVVAGLIGQHFPLGGVTWDYLQYLTGLQRLGHEVYYIEDSGERPYSLDGGATGHDWNPCDCTPNAEHLARTMERFGLRDRWSYRVPIGPRWYGMSDSKRAETLRTADLLLNVSGSLERPVEYRDIRWMAYIDSDPVFTQIKHVLGGGYLDFRHRVDAHDVHFTFGERLSSVVPSTGHRWLPTRQPITLSEWHPTPTHREVYTTVMSWTSYRPLLYKGEVYAQKDLELPRFMDLPALVAPAKLELAANLLEHVRWATRRPLGRVADAAEDELPNSLAEVLVGRGWKVVEPTQVCGSLDAYREYIESSKGEWSVAKNAYVRGQPGWFSGRSACYLAAGRPVIVQRTGFETVLPLGEGIVGYSTLEEAAAGIEDVERHYQRHAQSARAIAEEYFDSTKVLGRLLEDAFKRPATDSLKPPSEGATRSTGYSNVAL